MCVVTTLENVLKYQTHTFLAKGSILFQERQPVVGRNAVFLYPRSMHARSIPFVFFKSVFRKSFRKTHHIAVARHLCDNRGKTYRGNFLVTLNNSF